MSAWAARGRLEQRALDALDHLLDVINEDDPPSEPLALAFESASDMIFDGQPGPALAVIQSALARAGRAS
jgi:hypothetical protein